MLKTMLNRVANKTMICFYFCDGRNIQFNWKDVIDYVEENDMVVYELFGGTKAEYVLINLKQITQISQYDV